MADRGPFHAGERAMQARHALAERMAVTGAKLLRDRMTGQHRAFYPLLPFLVLAAAEPAGQPWATLLTGEPGFLRADDARRLEVGALPLADDPAAAGVRDAAPVGLLGLQPHTRRRNRLNGVVAAADGRGFAVAVRQSFGNCPKYIQARIWHRAEHGREPGAAERCDALTEADRALIAGADTAFVASRAADPADGLDASHRGGPPGFLRIEADDVLVWPEYPGNFYFNTLGNLLQEPRCGLAVPDWQTGDLLQFAGEAEIVEDHPLLGPDRGIVRAVRLRVRAVVRRPRLLPWHWRFLEYSPVLARVEPALVAPA